MNHTNTSHTPPLPFTIIYKIKISNINTSKLTVSSRVEEK
jgi:hypothetical protein